MSKAYVRSGVLRLFRSGKERLIQLYDYSSVASPESGLFSDWSRNRNKRYLEVSHDWLPVWQSDFQSRKSCELMASDEASEASFCQL